MIGLNVVWEVVSSYVVNWGHRKLLLDISDRHPALVFNIGKPEYLDSETCIFEKYPLLHQLKF